MNKHNYLDKNIITEFRNALNSSPIFYSEEEYKKHWNLICSMMDRVDSCIEYINSFDISNFDTEESLVCFLTYCCMLNDSVFQLFNSIKPLKDFYDKNIKEQSKYFKEDFVRFIKLYNENSEIISCSDDKFFEFLRAITFAHPLETNRQKFIKKNDKLYSPFVLIKSLFDGKLKNPIGVAIYSLLDDKTIHFWISANHIVNYICNKYSLLKQATNWLNKEIAKYSNKWSKRKVNRNLKGVDLLLDIKNILQERHVDTFYIDDAIDLLNCNVSDITNLKSVNTYKKALVKTFTELSDWVDSLQDDNSAPKSFYNMLDPRPKIMYPQAHYELSKIFSYLNDKIIDYKTYVANRNIYIKTNGNIDVSNFEWGLFQAELFFCSLGKQYINFDLSNINSATEVKLLTRTVLFMEIKKQKKGHVSRCIKRLINEAENRRKKMKVIKTQKLKTTYGDDITISIVDAS